MGSYTREKESAIAIARKIGEIERKYFRPREHTDHAPSLDSVVRREQLTIASIESEAQEAALKLFYEQYPKDFISANKETSSLNLFVKNNRKRSWFCDTLDGGLRHSAGSSHYGTTIGFRENDEFVVGIIYAPQPDIMYVAVKDEGVIKISAEFPKGTPVHIQDVEKDSPDDMVYLGSGVPGGLGNELTRWSNGVIFRQSAELPTSHRAINVLEGKAKAYLTYCSNICDMGPVSFVVQNAKGGSFIGLDVNKPVWKSTMDNGKEKIVLDSFAILGPQNYSKGLAKFVADVMSIVEE